MLQWMLQLMDGWMLHWMDEWMFQWMDGWMDRQLDGLSQFHYCNKLLYCSQAVTV